MDRGLRAWGPGSPTAVGWEFRRCWRTRHVPWATSSTVDDRDSASVRYPPQGGDRQRFVVRGHFRV